MATNVTAKSGLANRAFDAMGGDKSVSLDKIDYSIFKTNNDEDSNNNQRPVGNASASDSDIEPFWNYLRGERRAITRLFVHSLPTGPKKYNGSILRPL
jgi:hypothetical protein